MTDLELLELMGSTGYSFRKESDGWWIVDDRKSEWVKRELSHDQLIEFLRGL